MHSALICVSLRVAFTPWAGTMSPVARLRQHEWQWVWKHLCLTSALYLPQSCFSSPDTPPFPPFSFTDAQQHNKGRVCTPHFLLCLFNWALEWTCRPVCHICFLHWRIRLFLAQGGSKETLTNEYVGVGLGEVEMSMKSKIRMEKRMTNIQGMISLKPGSTGHSSSTQPSKSFYSLYVLFIMIHWCFISHTQKLDYIQTLDNIPKLDV